MRVGFQAAMLVLLVVSMGGAVEMQSFPIDWRTNPDSPVNMSRFLDKPAGKDGFVKIENGHFIKGNGERLRIWGINFSSRACFPEKEDAPVIAAYLARLGINGVRFHHMDNAGTRFLEGESGTSRKLNLELLDRLDFFIHELKKQGIYSNVNLNVARIFREGDGVKDTEYLGYAKAVTYFDERLIQLQKEFAEQLLTHFNPYTKSKYASEPAVLIVEIVNENSLIEYWMNGRLHGRDQRTNGGTWSDIPKSYANDLDIKFNRWLATHLSDPDKAALRTEAAVGNDDFIPRLSPQEFQKASPLRFHTEANFYVSVEEDFLVGMSDYLKNTLGVQSHIVGSSDHSHYRTGYPHLLANSQLDVVDGHVYWQHPNSKVENGKRTFTILNTPMVNDPFFSTVVQLARTTVVGKPYTVSETNHPYPHEYACEGVPVLAAYSLLQDWDGIFFYTFEHNTPDKWRNRQNGHFDFRPDSMKMVNLAASGMLFHRQDVKKAQKTVLRSYSRDSVIERMKEKGSLRPFYTPGFSNAIPLRHATRVSSLNGEDTPFSNTEEPSVIVSDTGELTWNVETNDKGYVIVDTPNAQGLIGFIRPETQTGNLSVDMKNEFASIQCLSLEDKPISLSSKLLLVATAKAANAGTVWNAKRNSLDEWGGEPMQIEPVAGVVYLRGLTDTDNLYYTPLDGSGRALSESIIAEKENKNWKLSIGQAATLWYLVEIRGKR
jgi:hypothetical protein